MNNQTKDFDNSKDLRKILRHKNVIPLLLNEYMTAEILDKTYIENAFVDISITSEIIEKFDINYLISFYNAILDSRIGRTCKFTISTSAYDNDTREVYQIPEYVNFIKNVFNRVPGLYSLLDTETTIWIPLCYAFENITEQQGSDTRIALNPQKLKEFFIMVIGAMDFDKRFSQKDIDIFVDEFLKYF